MTVIIKEIARTAGQNAYIPNIDIIAKSNFKPVAAISRDDNKFVLIYDKEAVENLNRDRRSNWRVAFALAHEVGHVALGHFSGNLVRCFTDSQSDNQRPCVPIKKLELDADRFAGCVLRLLGS